MSRADDALEGFLVRSWGWARSHYGQTLLTPWCLMTGGMYLTGDQWAAIVLLAIGTAIYYALAKLDAWENSKG